MYGRQYICLILQLGINKIFIIQSKWKYTFFYVFTQKFFPVILIIYLKKKEKRIILGDHIAIMSTAHTYFFLLELDLRPTYLITYLRLKSMTTYKNKNEVKITKVYNKYLCKI